MNDQNKTKAQLIAELEQLRKRVADLQAASDNALTNWEPNVPTAEELLTIFNMATELMCIADINTATFTKINPAFETVLGYSENELLSRSFLDFVHPEDVERTKAVVQEKLKQGVEVFSFENRYRCKDGSYRWLMWNSHPRPELGITFAVAHDLTELKQGAIALRESEEKFRTLIENIEQVFWIRDLQTRHLVYLSPGYEEIWGRPLQSAYHRSGAFIEAIHPEDVARVKTTFEQSLKGHPTDVEYRIVRPDNSVRWVWVRTFYVKNEAGIVDRQIGIAEDITRRKRSEERVKAALDEKEALLRELYHRTRNNMQVICALLDVQSACIAEVGPDVFDELKHRIQSMALVHQKLYQSQNLSSINLAEYITDLLSLLMSSFHISDDQIKLDLELEDISVLIDTAIPCGMVLNELLSNVLRHAFADEDYGTIRIDLYHTASEEVVIRVADNGVGVPADFDFRTQQTFGLQNVIALVEHQLQGEVTFESQKGVSCEVRFEDVFYKPRV